MSLIKIPTDPANWLADIAEQPPCEARCLVLAPGEYVSSRPIELDGINRLRFEAPEWVDGAPQVTIKAEFNHSHVGQLDFINVFFEGLDADAIISGVGGFINLQGCGGRNVERSRLLLGRSGVRVNLATKESASARDSCWQWGIRAPAFIDLEEAANLTLRGAAVDGVVRDRVVIEFGGGSQALAWKVCGAYLRNVHLIGLDVGGKAPNYGYWASRGATGALEYDPNPLDLPLGAENFGTAVFANLSYVAVRGPMLVRDCSVAFGYDGFKPLVDSTIVVEDTPTMFESRRSYL